MRIEKLCLCVSLALLATATMACAQESGGAAPVYHLENMHHHPWFWDVAIASTVGWMLGMVKGFSGSREWLERYWPNPPSLVIGILDFVIYAVVGGYFGTGIYNPQDLVAAMAAGLSWPVGFGALVSKG